MATILYGAPVSEFLLEKTKNITNKLKIKPTLATVRIGNDPGTLSYELGVSKKCSLFNIEHKKIELSENIEEEDLIQTLENLNNDDLINGILVFSPIPKNLNYEIIRDFLNEDKDVDGVTYSSLSGVFTGSDIGFSPCTAEAAMTILDYYKIDCCGKKVCIVGRSLVTGRPISMLALKKNATVTICHTKTQNLLNEIREADIIITTSGKAELFDDKYFNENQIIIDVGTSFNEKKNKISGDIAFEEVKDKVKAITPVPGGVGTVTTSVLMYHTAQALLKQLSILH